MKEKIEALRMEIETAMEQTQTGRALYELKVRFQTSLKGIMSGMKKLGALIGDGCEIGCGAVLMPGTVIGKGARIYPLAVASGIIASGASVHR